MQALAVKADFRIGHGYKLLEDDFAAAAEILTFENNSAVDTSFGFEIPSGLNFYEENKTLTVLEEFEDKSSYIRHRLKQLKVGSGLCLDFIPAFNMDVKAGCNVKNSDASKTSNSTHEMSFLLEKRSFKLTLKDTDGEYNFSARFKTEVNALPDEYDKSNEECVRLLKNFFEVSVTSQSS